MKSGMHMYVFLVLLWYFTCFYGLSHVNKPINFFPYQNDSLHYSDICNFYCHNKLSVGFSSGLKRNWKGINKKKLELELIERNWNWNCYFSSQGIGIGIGIERKGIGIELKERNWPQPCVCHQRPYFVMFHCVNWFETAGVTWTQSRAYPYQAILMYDWVRINLHLY